jgi:preprotein translocase subunit SecF
MSEALSSGANVLNFHSYSEVIRKAQTNANSRCVMTEHLTMIALAAHFILTSALAQPA